MGGTIHDIVKCSNEFSSFAFFLNNADNSNESIANVILARHVQFSVS